MSVDSILAHYGVKGMRWGVRRRSGGVSIGRRAKPIPSEDKEQANAARAKIGKRGNTDALTNKEMQTLVTRMNLEKNLNQLLANQKKSGPTAFVKKLVADTTRDELNQFAQGKQGKVVGTAIALGLGAAAGKHRRK